MLWINHAVCLKTIGATRAQFYTGITRQILRFTRSLRGAPKASGAPPRWAKAQTAKLEPAQ
jgi:hypothetical protein